LFLQLMGVVVLGFGIFALTDGKDVAKLVDWGSVASGSDLKVALYTTASTVLVVVAILAIIVAFLGCCGAVKENRCLLFCYYILLLILFIGVIIGGTIALSQSLYIIRTPLLDSLTLYNPDKTSDEYVETTHAWDDIQEAYSCCGVDSYSDWATTNGTIFNAGPGSHRVPGSCCVAFAGDKSGGHGSFDDCLANPFDPQFTSAMEGCLPTLSRSLESNRKTIGIVTGTIAAFMFINLVTLFSFAMCLNPRHEGYEMV